MRSSRPNDEKTVRNAGLSCPSAMHMDAHKAPVSGEQMKAICVGCLQAERIQRSLT